VFLLRHGPVNRDAILKQFDELTVWSSGDQRASHEPLLVLSARALRPQAFRMVRRT
jgi:hypothetical protein